MYGWNWRSAGAYRSLVIAVACALVLALGASCNGGGGNPDATATRSGPSGTIVVRVPGALEEAMAELARSFEEANDTVAVELALPPAIADTPAAGAALDVLVAEENAMQRALQEGVVVSDGRVIARDALAMIVPESNPGNVATLADLDKSGLRIALMHAETLAGERARALLTRLGESGDFAPDYGANVTGNITFEGEDTMAVIEQVVGGGADVAFVSASEVGPEVPEGIAVVPIPEMFNRPIEFRIDIAAGAPNRELAELFAEYVLSGDAQELFADLGYTPAN